LILLRHGAFYVSCLAAFTAGHVVNYAVILYAQEAIGSDLLAGIGFGLCFGPPLVLGWIAGAWCDRYPPTRLIHGAQALFVAAALLLWAGDRAAADVPSMRVALLVAARCWPAPAGRSSRRRAWRRSARSRAPKT